MSAPIGFLLWMPLSKHISTFASTEAVLPRERVHPLAAMHMAPRGLSRVEAAAYIGVSPNLFDEMVRDGRMPSAKRINARVVWDRLQLDAAFSALPNSGHAADDELDVWSRVAV